MTQTAYPYAGRDLFSEPEYYHFAKCATPDFYANWRGYRDSQLIKLKAVATNFDLTDFEVGGSNSNDDESRSLRSILLNMIGSLDRDSTDMAAKGLEPFVVKYEVHRRLFDRFLANDLRHPDSRVACWGDYVLFAYVLARISEKSDSLKHLSTLLKICDALTSLPVSEFSDAEAALLAHILEIEAEMVSVLDEKYALS